MKKIILLAAASLSLVACDENDNNPATPPVAARITATIGESGYTRAGDTSWAPGDRIGITTVYRADETPSLNLPYTTPGGDGVFEGDVIYIYNPMTVAAYYPFSGEAGVARGLVDASTDAGSQADGKRQEIDFLYASVSGVTTDDPEVSLTFSHKMSKLTLIFNDGEGMDVGRIVSYSIDGLALDGTFDTATGACAVKADASPAPLVMSFDGETVKSGEALPYLILFPQGAAKLTLAITDNEGQQYACPLDVEGDALKPGESYEWRITVSKTGLVVNSAAIADWSKTEMKGEAGSVL